LLKNNQGMPLHHKDQHILNFQKKQWITKPLFLQNHRNFYFTKLSKLKESRKQQILLKKQPLLTSAETPAA